MQTIEQRMQQAMALHQQGQLDAAEREYMAILDVVPEHAEALCYIGMVHFGRNQLPTSVAWFERCLAKHPSHPEANYNLGVVLQRLNQPGEALRYYQQALKVASEATPILYNIGVCFQQLEDFDGAQRYFERLLERDPQHLGGLYGVALCLDQLGDGERAVVVYKKILAIQPDHVETYANLANLYHKSGKHVKAEATVITGLTYAKENPNQQAFLYHNLGKIYQDQGRLDEALKHYQYALRSDARRGGSWNNVGLCLQQLGRQREATIAFERSLQMEPQNHAAHSNMLLGMLYEDNIRPGDIRQAHEKWDKQQMQGERAARPVSDWSEGKRPIRVAYVSPNFMQHAVIHFLRPLLDNHDAKAVDVWLYSNTLKSDAHTEYLKQGPWHWRDISDVSDEDLADTVKRDGIDILVDLAGHTEGNRLRAFGRRLAPIQASYLGYPGTTGVAAMDYYISDSVTHGPGDSDGFVEKIKTLASPFFGYHPFANAPDPNVRAQPNADEPIVLGSFHILSRLNKSVIALWSEVLKAVPDSVLLITRNTLTDETQTMFRELFAKQGIDGERLVLKELSYTTPGSHLASYHAVDIGLDTFPWSGHTTATEGCWMGVPMVTLRGEVHRHRMVATLNHALGLDDCIAESKEDYIAKVKALAQNHERRRYLREHLRQIMQDSVIMDGKRLARDMEDLYLEMIQVSTDS